MSVASIILGIHSNVLGSGSYIERHAWISVTRYGITDYYGLQPDDHPKTTDNGPGWDIRKGIERNSKPKASRYYKLSENKANLLNQLLRQNISWSHTNNCSSWAQDVIWKIVREDVDADDYFGFETPRELARNIELLEAKNPTNELRPKNMIQKPSRLLF